MKPTILPAVTEPGASLEELQAYLDLQRRIGGLSLVEPLRPIQEKLQSGNAWLLLAGEHRGLNITKPAGRLHAAPGAYLSRRAVLSTSVDILGLKFGPSGESDRALALVDVTAAASVVFYGCHFERQAEDTGFYVNIASGGRASFVGCTFSGTPAAAFAINNAGALVNVGVVGGSNRTGLGHNNVTVIWETT